MENSPETKKIELGQDILRHLNITRKWTMFLSITGFIFLGLLVILGIITGTFLTAFNLSDKIPGMPDAVLMALVFGVALVCFFPVLFLYRFSKYTSVALATYDRGALHKALKYLKLYFVYVGILLIVVITVYLAGIIIAGTSAAFIKGF
jgi:hypothetical protein